MRQSRRSACSYGVVGGPLVKGRPTPTPAQPMKVMSNPSLAARPLDTLPSTTNDRLYSYSRSQRYSVLTSGSGAVTTTVRCFPLCRNVRNRLPLIQASLVSRTNHPIRPDRTPRAKPVLMPSKPRQRRRKPIPALRYLLQRKRAPNGSHRQPRPGMHYPTNSGQAPHAHHA